VQNDNRPAIALIGGGPRGVSLLERIGAALDADGGVEPLTIHIVDDVQVGAGRIWRTDQTRELCMNTLAGAVTLFTDASVTMAGPIRPGPTLYEWAVLAAHSHETSRSAAEVEDVPAERRRTFAQTPVRAGFAEEFADELDALRPESHPSRALYGEYIRWCFTRALQTMPPNVTVSAHIARADEVVPDGRREQIVLSDGHRLTVDALVMATGWMPRTPTPEELAIAHAVEQHPGMVWVRPASPVDQELDDVPDGADAIVRGLGMGFFDAMALLTVGRGGRFVPDASAGGGLRYEPSGREPILHVTSHRGVPYRAKSVYGGLPPRAPQHHLRAVDWAAVPRPIDFDRMVWPLIVKDAFADYYATLARVRPDAFASGPATTSATSSAAVQRVIDESAGDPASLSAAIAAHVPDARDRFDFGGTVDPAGGGVFGSPADFDAWVSDFVADDLRESAVGADSPLKAALWSLSSARQPAGQIGAFGGFDAESRAGGFRRLQAVGGMAGSGPPAFRNRQLLALIEAGLVRFIGPGARVRLEGGRFHAASPAVAGSDVSTLVLIDAWMHFHDAAASEDPLIGSLAARGRLRPFAVTARSGRLVATGGVDVDPGTGRVIGADGERDRAVHIAGIPVEETMHDSIISPMPGTDATMLRETDRVARSLLRTAFAARDAAAPREGGPDA